MRNEHTYAIYKVENNFSNNKNNKNEKKMSERKTFLTEIQSLIVFVLLLFCFVSSFHMRRMKC